MEQLQRGLRISLNLQDARQVDPAIRVLQLHDVGLSHGRCRRACIQLGEQCSFGRGQELLLRFLNPCRQLRPQLGDVERSDLP